MSGSVNNGVHQIFLIPALACFSLRQRSSAVQWMSSVLLMWIGQSCSRWAGCWVPAIATVTSLLHAQQYKIWLYLRKGPPWMAVSSSSGTGDSCSMHDWLAHKLGLYTAAWLSKVSQYLWSLVSAAPLQISPSWKCNIINAGFRTVSGESLRGEFISRQIFFNNFKHIMKDSILNTVLCFCDAQGIPSPLDSKKV